MVARVSSIVALVVATVGCGSEDTPAPAATTTSSSTGAGGGPADGCPPGEATLTDGSCQAAGIPDGRCGEGFESEGTGSCVAVMPSVACEGASMAIPGETECRPVWPCGTTAWGDIPVGPDTQYVDAAYAGADSDGTEAKPWTTIQAGIDAAVDRAVVAVAAGDYTEDILVQNTTLRVRGRCPEMVRLHGTGAEVSTVLFGDAAHDSELGGMAIDGPGLGVIVSGSDDVVLEGLWVHDTGNRGIDVENAFGPASVTVRDSVVEGARDAGIIVLTSTLHVERSVVRDMKSASGTGQGRGIVARREATSNEGATLFVSSSVVHRATHLGIFVQASEATIESTLVTDTQANVMTDDFGTGITIEADPNDGARSTATVRTTVVERATDEGLFIAGSDVVLERVVIRDTQPHATTLVKGVGLHVQNADPPGGRGNAQVSQTVVEGNLAIGLSVDGADAALHSSIVRGTRSQVADGIFGRGANVALDPATLERSVLSLRDSVIADNVETGIAVNGSDLIVEHSVIRDTVCDVIDKRLGRGIEVQSALDLKVDASATVRTSLLERNHDVGIALVGGSGIIEDTIIRETLPRDLDQDRGRGIAIIPHVDGVKGSLVVRGGRIEKSTDVGLSAYAVQVTLENLVISETAPNVKNGLFGDGMIMVGGIATLTGVRVEKSARVGVAAFSAEIALAGSSLECNAIHLDRETLLGPAVFDDAGGNVCGCGGESVACQVVSSNLAAPEPPD